MYSECVEYTQEEQETIEYNRKRTQAILLSTPKKEGEIAKVISLTHYKETGKLVYFRKLKPGEESL